MMELRYEVAWGMMAHGLDNIYDKDVWIYPFAS